jgi:hypothetical protein
MRAGLKNGVYFIGNQYFTGKFKVLFDGSDIAIKPSIWRVDISDLGVVLWRG